MEDIKQAFSEVYDIINHFEERIYNKIPTSFIEKIKEYKDDKYYPQIDYSISINEQNLLNDTKVILSLIYRDYICSSEKEEELKKKDIIELKRYQEKNEEQYNYDDLFKKNKLQSKNTNETNQKQEQTLIEYKKNCFDKIIKKIKKLIYNMNKN